MSSTDFNTPPVKLIMLAVSLVVGLHVLTAVALVAIKPPAPNIELPKVTPPIEIEMITLPPPPIESEEVVIEEREEEPVKKVKTQPKAKPVAAAKPKVVKKTKSIDKPKPAVKKTVKPVEDKPDVIKKKPTETVKPNNNQQLPMTNQPTAAEIEANRLEAQRLEAERRKIQTALEAEELRKAQALAKAAQDKVNAEAEKAAQLQAQKDVELKAKEEAQKAEQAKTAAAASNEPVSYGNIGKSSWSKEPIFTSIKNKDYGLQGFEASISVSMSVDSNGNIGNIRKSKSSGNSEFDRDFIRALSKAKLHPATRGNNPTKSTATFTFRMNL